MERNRKVYKYNDDHNHNHGHDHHDHHGDDHMNHAHNNEHLSYEPNYHQIRDNSNNQEYNHRTIPQVDSQKGQKT